MANEDKKDFNAMLWQTKCQRPVLVYVDDMEKIQSKLGR